MTTNEQRMAALTIANQVRLDRAKLKMRMAAGEVKPWLIIADPPACIHGIDCFAFVSWMPRQGRVRATTLLTRAGIRSSKLVGNLTPMQRERLSAVLFDFTHPTDARTSVFNAESRRIMRGEKGTI